MAQQIKNMLAMQETQETQVWSLGQENPLEEENGNPLWYSWLKNAMDWEAQWSTLQRVTKSQTSLSG